MERNYDFAGWATKYGIRCSDGRTIMKGAFADMDGKTVPLVWNHKHGEVGSVLGHALFESRNEGMYTYGYFNDTDSGSEAKKLVDHGDVVALSIYANQLKEASKCVEHGVIREVSLVLAGANPGAFIDSVIRHSDGTWEEDPEQGVFYTGLPLVLEHAADNKDDDKESEREPDTNDSNDNDDVDSASGGDETGGDIMNTLTEKQLAVVLALIDTAVSGANTNNSEEGNNMRHNLFEGNDEQAQQNVLSAEDERAILHSAIDNRVSSLRNLVMDYAESNDMLAHTDNGVTDIDQLFPEYHDVRPGAPEKLTTDQGWISHVLNKVHKSPISRIRTRQADIRNIENLRAQGYAKQGEKAYRGNISLLYRTTDPQTVYVKSKLDRDDIVDITDFDVVQYLYDIDRANLNEELATAIMLGDGRETGAAGKIDETKIRPIWTDDELYTIHADVDLTGMASTLNGTNTGANFGENYIYAEAIIQSLLYAREKYKGSANPDFYCTPHLLNVMLLARDLNGRRIYDNVNDLKAALNVSNIITAEQFEGRTRTVTKNNVTKTKKLLALMVNLGDYSLGATKGGQITHFTDFDLDFNQEKSLLETRCSGANTRVMSAIALEEEVANPT